MEYFSYDPIQKGYPQYSMMFHFGFERERILRTFEEYKEDVLIILPEEDKDGSYYQSRTSTELTFAQRRSSIVALSMGDDFFLVKNRYNGKLGHMGRDELEAVVKLLRGN